MKSFIVGQVVDPVISGSKNGSYCKFGILSGRHCDEYTIFEKSVNSDGTFKPNDLYDKAVELKDGDVVCAIVNTVVTKNNTLGVYLQNLGAISDDLRDEINSIF